jgi:Flp pilus assembly CpaF family ATPase
MDSAGIKEVVRLRASAASVTREHPIIESELPKRSARFAAMIPPVMSAPTFTSARQPEATAA